jgi:hypothetical protein
LKAPTMALILILYGKRFVWHDENGKNWVGNRIAINNKLRIEHAIVKGERFTGVRCS